MKPTRAAELYFDPEPDLFMLTPRELADRALALAEACCHRAEHDADALNAPAVRTALRAVRLAVRLGRRAAADESAELGSAQAAFCPCPRRIP
ncbi:hypothetical protein [Streptomyces yunnanensis]|uniref:Uncharacterized protein n=1 Tax=Streptomyces yunnanensis TaxID=156453 RepID=A0A9X8N971_9ACTN|nr:hypothetical protein [Streptomyces yunnanensis]SHN32385.1 hypothetical protein SAMN05216268_13614 [Streptomyces yunnanensis]